MSAAVLFVSFVVALTVAALVLLRRERKPVVRPHRGADRAIAHLRRHRVR